MSQVSGAIVAPPSDFPKAMHYLSSHTNFGSRSECIAKHFFSPTKPFYSPNRLGTSPIIPGVKAKTKDITRLYRKFGFLRTRRPLLGRCHGDRTAFLFCFVFFVNGQGGLFSFSRCNSTITTCSSKMLKLNIKHQSEYKMHLSACFSLCGRWQASDRRLVDWDTLYDGHCRRELLNRTS